MVVILMMRMSIFTMSTYEDDSNEGDVDGDDDDTEYDDYTLTSIH